MIQSGIYSITHISSGKRYIGSSVNIKRRWNAHRSALSRKLCDNPHLQNAWTKYGKESFLFEVLEDDILSTLLEDKENEYIAKYGIGTPGSNIFDNEKGYNTTWAGRTGCVDPLKVKRGVEHHLYGKPSPYKGKIYSDDIRKNMSDGQKGKVACHTQPHTEEAKQKMSAKMKNKPWSQARRDAQNKKELKDGSVQS
jgi:group I intron endonuclease